MIADANKQGITSYRTVAIVSSDTPHTRDVGRGAVDFAKTAGLQVIAEKQVPFRTTDFSGVIPGLKAVSPDIVFLALWPPEMFAFVKQAEELGLAAERTILPLSWRGVWAGSGRAAGRGRGGGELQRPEVVCGKRVEKALARAGLKPYEMNWTAIKVTCLEAMLQAIQDAGTVDRSKIMATLRGYSADKPIKALYGPLYFNFNVAVDSETANGFGTQFPIVMQIQGGKQVVVWPKDIQDASYRPIPWLGAEVECGMRNAECERAEIDG